MQTNSRVETLTWHVPGGSEEENKQTVVSKCVTVNDSKNKPSVMAAAGDAHAYHGVDVDVVLRSLPPVLRAKLKAQGFRSDSDFIGIQPLELSSEARISHDDALLVLQELHGRDTGVLGQSNVQSVGIGELERLEERCAASRSPARSTRSPHKNTRDPTLVGERVSVRLSRLF